MRTNQNTSVVPIAFFIALIALSTCTIDIFGQPLPSTTNPQAAAYSMLADAGRSDTKLARVTNALLSLEEMMNDSENPPDASLRKQYDKLRTDRDRLAQGYASSTHTGVSTESHESDVQREDSNDGEIKKAVRAPKPNWKEGKSREDLELMYENELYDQFPDITEERLLELHRTAAARVKANPHATSSDPVLRRVIQLYQKYFAR